MVNGRDTDSSESEESEKEEIEDEAEKPIKQVAGLNLKTCETQEGEDVSGKKIYSGCK